MRIIGFITDWGRKDGSVATCEAIMRKIAPYIGLVHISHTVEDIEEAAFVLGTSYQWFPQTTIFLVVVDPGVGTERKAVILKTDKFYFVGPDNGVFSGVENIEKVVKIESERYFLSPVSTVFHGRDIFAPVAAHLATGISMSEFGPTIKRQDLVQFPLLEAIKEKDKLRGHVIFVDDFGNLVTSVTKKVFFDFVGSSKFEIQLGHMRIDSLAETFADGKEGEAIARFGGDFRTPQGHDLLTIAVNQGSAAQTFEARRGVKVIVFI